MGQEIIGRRTIRRWLDNWEHIQRREPMEDQVKVNSGCKPRMELQTVCLTRSCWKWLTTAYPLNLGGLLTIAGLSKDSTVYCRR